MKKLLFSLLGLGACQPHVAFDRVPGETKVSKVAQAGRGGTDSLLTATLSVYDLSPVLCTLPADVDDIVEPMNGFFGPDRYRIELVFTSVIRDPRQPAHYLIHGKSRYKGQLMPLVGAVKLTQLQRQPEGCTGGTIKAAYTALGYFELRGAVVQAARGTFRGRVAVDWAVAEGGKVLQYTDIVPIPNSEGRIRDSEPSTKTPTLGGGILYDGTWTNASGRVTPVVWTADLLAYHGPQVLSDFAVGGRMLDVNPKYAKLGWSHYWENDEWWADAPKHKPVL